MQPNTWLITVSIAWTLAICGALLAMVVMY